MNAQTRKKLERLLDDLLWLSQQEFLDGDERDRVSYLRFAIEEHIGHV